eukprot:14877173-Ditylum_brightwellii.AAC.1
MNPEIGSVKLPIKTEKLEVKDLSKLRVKQLKQILEESSVECLERGDYIKRVDHQSSINLAYLADLHLAVTAD